ncbi:uncharacterized protein N7496_011070 [Penicillium cataractarum]|uniref:Uncharacterized protein n=1 Tax=Penicillium cataractarum TaxID=2100454 RepID=A0A9W9REA1_9EURO|nr:uncharacterized protein N7496_011070 [Penicillium cataractarum]KAJ5358657.1 hypothetical protein N7496_011070 [Penicillium cataractarum]
MANDTFGNCNYDIPGWEFTIQTCCLAQSSFNYRPTFAGNLIFTILFCILIIPQLFLGIRHKTWGYMAGTIIGFAFEALGYAGRVRLHINPFESISFWIYLIAVTIAPVFISAAIYLCLARIMRFYGEQNVRFAPRTIAIGFMTSDFTSLVLQAAGGAYASMSEGYTADRRGAWIMIAGLILQVVSLGGDFAWRYFRGSVDQCPERRRIRGTNLFKAFEVSLLAATVTILTRSAFRVAELWNGFSSSLWNDQVAFMVLDGAMVGVASLLLSVFHPGPAFGGQWSAMSWSFKRSKNVDG